MASSIPQANTVLQDQAGVGGTGIDNIALIAAVPLNPDAIPRLFGSADDINSFHGYGRHVEYAALHFANTRKPVIMCGVPISAAGVLASVDQAGNTGTSLPSIVPGLDGVLHEHSGTLRVVKGGQVGVDQIVLEYSLDPTYLGAARLWKKYRLGTSTSLALQVGVVISFGPGTLVAGETILDWLGSDPLTDVDGIAAARHALAGQQKLSRSWLLCGDLQNATQAQGLVTHAEAYETENQRFIYARGSIKDRLPLPEMSHPVWKMSPVTSLTFATAGTITRAAGSWVTDGAATGDFFSVLGSVSSDGKYRVTAITPTAITVAPSPPAAEVAPGASLRGTGYMGLAFATGGAVTRSRGSWLADGFATAESVAIEGSAFNDTTGQPITALTALTLTRAAGTAEAIAATDDVSVSVAFSKAAWMAGLDAAFASVNSKRVDLSVGRNVEPSLYSGWNFRIPAAWFASLREFQHDVHVATWRKDVGPVGGDLDPSEWDDRVDGSAASQARFTSLRTWGNGPEGAFITLSLTRAEEGSLTSLTNNMAVIDVAMSTTQTITENVIGRSLVLQGDGTATGDARKLIEGEVNGALEAALLTNTQNEGQRASRAVWEMNPTDVLNHPNPADNIVTGVLELMLNGLVFKVNTAVRVITA